MCAKRISDLHAHPSVGTQPWLGDAARLDAADAASEAFAAAGAPEEPAETADRAVSATLDLVRSLLDDVLAEAAERMARRLDDVLRAHRVTSDLGEDQLVTRDQLAVLLGVHVKTLQRMEREGDLPAAGRFGATAVYSLGTVRAILRAAAAGQPTGTATASGPKRGRPAKL